MKKSVVDEKVFRRKQIMRFVVKQQMMIFMMNFFLFSLLCSLFSQVKMKKHSTSSFNDKQKYFSVYQSICARREPKSKKIAIQTEMED